MAKQTKGLPKTGIDLNEKSKKKRDTTLQTLNKKMRKTAIHKARKQIGIEKQKKTLANKKATITTEETFVSQSPTVIAPSSRFEKMVNKVNSLEDIKKLKKIIYNRNYRLKQKFKKENPEIWKQQQILKYPPINDLNIIPTSAFHRLKRIKDQDKLVDELKKLIINTTRRKNRPKVAADYSNREQDYLENSVFALQEAVANWSDDILRMKLQGSIKQITMDDINSIFREIPSYWAISSGYYYAVTDFDDFMDAIYSLIEKTGVKLSSTEKESMADRLFKNDPRDHAPLS